MRERPILFNGSMVREVLAGRKTQTRRVVTARTCEMGSGEFAACDLSRAWVDPGGTWLFGPGPYLKAPAWHEYDDGDGEELVHRIYPRWRARDEERGEPGDLLWVREAHAWMDGFYGSELEDPCHVGYRANREVRCFDAEGSFVCDSHGINWEHALVRWRPSIHMPRWASRITLRVTEVRVERVQSITEEDARAEGVSGGACCRCGDTTGSDEDCARSEDGHCVCWWETSAVNAFETLWDSINAARGFGWAANPWVWVVSFEREEPRHV